MTLKKFFQDLLHKLAGEVTVDDNGNWVQTHWQITDDFAITICKNWYWDKNVDNHVSDYDFGFVGITIWHEGKK